MNPIELEDVRIGESNAPDFLLIEKKTHTGGLVSPIKWQWTQAAFVHRDDVVTLRDWLNKWLEEVER